MINGQQNKEQRRFLVLGHIIDEYVGTAAPVSSKAVTRRMGGSVSSATIRNIMARLEDEGYIGQPHTSAGRIPTHSGYRQYVDLLKDRIRLEKREARRLTAEYDLRIRTIKDVLERTSFLISRELRNAGLVMWPSIEDFYLKHLELIKVNAETVLAVLVTMTNAVRNHVIKLDKDLENAELSRIANYINDNYGHFPFMEISEGIRRKISHAYGEDAGEIIEIGRSALSVIDSMIEANIENEISWEGLDYFMEEPEFRDSDVTRRVFKVFSDRRELVRLMRGELPYEGIRIHIGSENDSDGLKECSVITSGYTLHGRTAGRIGVIGPTRMDYGHALRTITCLSDLISGKLQEIDKSK